MVEQRKEGNGVEMKIMKMFVEEEMGNILWEGRKSERVSCRCIDCGLMEKWM